MFIGARNILPFFKEVEQKAKGDRNIWAAVIILFIFSILAVYSTSGFLKDINPRQFNNYLIKQLLFVSVGILIVYIGHNINYMFYYKISFLLFIMALILLIYTLFFGININEGTRWVRIPGINLTFQTSDFAKTTLIIFIARLLSKNQKKIHDFKKGFLPIALAIVSVCVLIAPSNLSTAMIIACTGFLLLFIGRARLKHLLIFFITVLGIPLAILIGIAYMYFDKTHNESEALPTYLKVSRLPVWIKRVQLYMFNTEKEDMSYQSTQANIAIAKGGIFGVGPGNSKQKYFLPLAYSDFIYAIIIEEYGILVGIFILCIYLYFLYRCILIFRKFTFGFGAILSVGLSLMLVIQALINILVNVDLVPTTGIGLPLISMGGSSYILTCLSIGIILSVARSIDKQETENTTSTKPKINTYYE